MDLMLGFASIESTFVAWERVAGFLQMSREEDELEEPPLMASLPTPTEIVVEFKQVSFRYRFQRPLVLEDLSFKVLMGEKVALVGRTGKEGLSLVPN